MTDARRVRRPSLWAVGAASVLAFVVVLALLAAQMRFGRDPVVGARRATAGVAPAPREVLVRRVIVKRIVVDEIHDAEQGVTAPPARAVVVTPAPAPASAPAPAPAPLVTKSS
jgi:resuscitation-promoting factor RpfA